MTVEIRNTADGRDQAVAAVSLHNGELKTALQFSGGRSISDVFHPDISEYLLGLIDRTVEAPTVLTDRDVVRFLAYAVVAYLRNLACSAGATLQGIASRVVQPFGNVAGRFFRPTPLRHCPLSARDQMPTQPPDNIPAPLTNIASRLDQILQDRHTVWPQTRKPEDEAIELKFYTELLRRYVDDCALDRDMSAREHVAPNARCPQSDTGGD